MKAICIQHTEYARSGFDQAPDNDLIIDLLKISKIDRLIKATDLETSSGASLIYFHSVAETGTSFTKTKNENKIMQRALARWIKDRPRRSWKKVAATDHSTAILITIYVQNIKSSDKDSYLACMVESELVVAAAHAATQLNFQVKFK